jgi:hypothetical protein
LIIPNPARFKIIVDASFIVAKSAKLVTIGTNTRYILVIIAKIWCISVKLFKVFVLKSINKSETKYMILKYTNSIPLTNRVEHIEKYR